MGAGPDHRLRAHLRPRGSRAPLCRCTEIACGQTEPGAAVWIAAPEQRRILLIFALLLNGQQPIRRSALDLLQTAIWPRQLNAIDARFIAQAEIDAIVS